MFKRRYLVWWRYTDNGRHVFKSKFYNSYEEAMEFVKKHNIHYLNYDIEEFLFEA